MCMYYIKLDAFAISHPIKLLKKDKNKWFEIKNHTFYWCLDEYLIFFLLFFYTLIKLKWNLIYAVIYSLSTITNELSQSLKLGPTQPE